MVGFPRSGSRERVSEPGEICYNVSKIRNFDTSCPMNKLWLEKQRSETTHTSKIV